MLPLDYELMYASMMKLCLAWDVYEDSRTQETLRLLEEQEQEFAAFAEEHELKYTQSNRESVPMALNLPTSLLLFYLRFKADGLHLDEKLWLPSMTEKLYWAVSYMVKDSRSATRGAMFGITAELGLSYCRLFSRLYSRVSSRIELEEAVVAEKESESEV